MKRSLVLLFAALFTFTHTPVYANSGENVRPIGVVIQTQDIPTEDGKGHFEVRTFEVKSEAELARVQAHLHEFLQSELPMDLQAFEVIAKDSKRTPLDEAATQSLQRIVNAASVTKKNIYQSIKLNTLFDEHLTITLSLVRFVANSGTISAGLVLGHGIPLNQSLIIGLMAGSFSGLLQYKINTVGKWITQGKNLITAARKLRISKNESDQLTQAELNFQEVEKYIRWGAIETAFLATINATMLLLNIPVEGNFFLTVLKSTASQGILDIGIFNLANYLKQQNPANEARINRMTSVGLFFASGVSVMVAASALVGIPIADVGFIAMTATGVALKMYPRLSEWRNKRLATRSCQMLFQ